MIIIPLKQIKGDQTQRYPQSAQCKAEHAAHDCLPVVGGVPQVRLVGRRTRSCPYIK